MKNALTFLVFLFGLSAAFSQEKFEVFFDFNSNIPNQESNILLNNWILNHKNCEILKITGFCDSIDNKSYNKKLSTERLENILLILETNKIKISKSIDKQAFGKDFEQSKIQAENRKVVFYFKETSLSEKIKTSKNGDLLLLKNIHFENHSPILTADSKPILKELLQIMIDYPKLKIEIQGHICCEKYNETNNISTLRAAAIYDYLIKNKIDKARLKYKGYGNKKPIFSIPEKNVNEENANRRVEILILEN